MRKIFYIIIILQCFTINLFSQWVWQQFNPSIYLYDIQFVNNNTGYVCGTNSTIAKTTDGGQTWFGQYVGTNTPKYLMGISMLNENTGYVTGYISTILKTTDGGNNWIILKDVDINGSAFTDISFINVNTGWICGFGGNIQKTTDGGITWDSITINNGYETFRSLQFINEYTGYTCGDGGTYTYKTTDGGYKWFRHYLCDSMWAANTDLYFINKDTGWVIEDNMNNNRLYRTTNGGNYWQLISIIIGPQYFHAYSLAFLNFNNGWIGGSVGTIFRTTDGGQNWSNENAYSPGFVSNFSFYKDSLIWASGGHGAIGLRNIYLGLQKTGNKMPLVFILYQNYPNPFNPVTIIKYNIPKPEMVSIKIYDVLGKEIYSYNEYKQTGRFEIQFDGSNYASGVYFYKIIAGDFVSTKRMVLLK